VPVGVLCVVVMYLLFTARSRAWSMGLDDREQGDREKDAEQTGQ